MLLEDLDSFDIVIVVYGGLPDSRFVLQKSIGRMASSRPMRISIRRGSGAFRDRTGVESDV